MKLLILAQKVNYNDPVLGFFHGWIKEFSKHCKKITVICLEKGEYDLPPNVSVFSLGKPAQGWPASGGEKYSYHSHLIRRFVSIYLFYKFIWRERKSYNAIFVHMNQEYILLGGLLWLLLDKKIFMWRNHHAGNWLTDIASAMCSKVFCTSKYSYTAKYQKTVIMPVGINTETFKLLPNILRTPRSILFLARMAPVKRPDVLIEALKILKDRGIVFSASFYGDPISSDEKYYQALKKQVVENGLSNEVIFGKGLSDEAVAVAFNQHEIFVNLSPSGMYDKTILSAMTGGGLSLSSNKNLLGEIDERLLFEENDLNDLVQKLEALLTLDQVEKGRLISDSRKLVNERHSLNQLADKLKREISSAKPLPHAQVLKYIIAGGTAATVDLSFLYLFTSVFHIWYIFSAVMAFLIAFGVSFLLQKFWTFNDQNTERWKSQMTIYFIITSFNLSLNTLLLYLFVDYFHWHYLIAQIIAGALVASQSYFTYQKFVFKSNDFK